MQGMDQLYARPRFCPNKPVPLMQLQYTPPKLADPYKGFPGMQPRPNLPVRTRDTPLPQKRPVKDVPKKAEPESKTVQVPLENTQEQQLVEPKQKDIQTFSLHHKIPSKDHLPGEQTTSLGISMLEDDICQKLSQRSKFYVCRDSDNSFLFNVYQVSYLMEGATEDEEKRATRRRVSVGLTQVPHIFQKCSISRKGKNL